MISEPRPPVIIIDDPNSEAVLGRPKQRRKIPRIWVYSAVLGALLASLFVWSMRPSEVREEGNVFSVAEGATLEEMLLGLERSGIIRSQALARLFIMIYGDETRITAGEYFFEGGAWLPSVAKQLAQGDHNIPEVKVTFPEGSSTKDMRDILVERIPQFDGERFLRLAEEHEGYLFPNTYEFFATVSPETVIRMLREEFDDQILAYLDEIEASGRSLSDIVIMASILEGEAATDEDRATIAGVLWKRLDSRTPLQVDATFVYLLGKGSAALTLDDLSVESPYNTYRNKGLPPGPINNPGAAAIEAALGPTQSPYWFYLSDDAGTIHYSKTFDEHKEKKARYLR